MKKFIFIAILFSINCILFAQPGFVWAKQIVSKDVNMENRLVLDGAGNIYMTGVFYDTTDVDPGSGVLNLIAAGQEDVFILKLDNTGNLLWAKGFGGTGSDFPSDIKLDSNGNIILSGSFSWVGDFDPGPGTYNLSTNGNYDSFLSKLDPWGNLIWAKSFGGYKDDYSSGIAVDASNSICITGMFEDKVDFDPGIGSYTISTATWTQDSYISKFDAMGNFVWVSVLSSNNGINSSDITFNSNNDIIVSGGFFGTVDFDPGLPTFTITSTGSWDIFACKLNSAGNFLWAKQMGGGGADIVYASTVDLNNNILLTGEYSAGADFDPGAGTYTLQTLGFENIFVSKLDNAGNFIWAKNIGSGSQFGWPKAITTDASANVYIGGLYSDTADFDPGTGIYQLVSKGSEDVFVCKLNSGGNFICAGSMGGAGADGAYSISLDQYNNIYTCGVFSGYAVGTSDFNPTAGTYNLTSTSGYDIFISKLSDCAFSTGLEVVNNNDQFAIYPNPSTGKIKLYSEGHVDQNQIKVYNALGEEIKNIPLLNGNEIDLSRQAKGIYFMEILVEEKRTVRKIILE